MSLRERQVFMIIGSGKSCKVAARTLNISVRTVETYVVRIAARLPHEGPPMLRLRFEYWLRSRAHPPSAASVVS